MLTISSLRDDDRTTHTQHPTAFPLHRSASASFPHAAMALMPTACLIVVCVFALLRQCDEMWHWIHRALFTGLTFYIPPSDATIQALLPRGAVSHLSSKTRKRLAKRAGMAPGSLKPLSSLSTAPSESFDLTWASIPRSAFVKAGNSSFAELRNYLGVHLALLMLVFVEQSWVCYHTTNSTRFDDGAVTVEMGAHVTSPTVVMLIVAAVYNLWVGLRVFARGTAGVSSAGSSYWNRMTFALAFLFFMLAWFIQGLRSGGASLLSSFLGAGDEQLYAQYANQLTFSALQKLHAVFREAAASSGSGSGSKDLVREWLPTLPGSASEMRMESYLSLGAVKILLALMCSLISVCFFTSSWRAAKLMHEKIEENDERLAEGTAVASTAAVAAAADAEDADKPMSVRDRLSLHFSSLLQYVNLLSPFVVVLLWLPPFSSQLWMRLFAQSLSTPGATEDSVARSMLKAWRSFELFRVAFVLGALILRLVLVRSALQTWLLSSLSAIKRLPASTSALPENHIAVRMKALLNATFWCTPLMAWQYLYPLCLTLVLLCSWKLASEWMPPGSDSSPALQGWGVCFAVWGKGWSMDHVPANYLRTTTSAAGAAAAPAVSRSLTAADLDADEFEGDLAEIEVAAAAESAAAAPLLSLPPASLTPSGFESPSHSNVLATALGFLLWWSHVAWFVETVLCYSYLRYNKRMSQKTQLTPAVTMSKVDVDVNGGASNGSSSAASSSSAAGLHQRRPAA